eukprot:1752926-Pyramimonas_sp.AAC.1
MKPCWTEWACSATWTAICASMAEAMILASVFFLVMGHNAPASRMQLTRSPASEPLGMKENRE